MGACLCEKNLSKINYDEPNNYSTDDGREGIIKKEQLRLYKKNLAYAWRVFLAQFLFRNPCRFRQRNGGSTAINYQQIA